MKLSDKLKSERTTSVELLERLAKAAEGRAFTPDEKQQWDDAKATAARLEAEIKTATEREEVIRGSAPAVLSMRELAPGEVRAFTNKERMFEKPVGEALSFGRLVRAVPTRDWRHAQGELKALGENPPSTGGVLVPTELFGTVIDLARNLSVMVKAGTLSFPMATQTMTVAKLLTDPVAYWRAEHAAITESEPTFGPITYKARALACLVRASVELAEDAPNFNSAVEASIAAALALQMDRAGLNGSGLGEEPLGVLNTAGVQSVSLGADGDELESYKPFVSAQIDYSTGRMKEAPDHPLSKTIRDGVNERESWSDFLETLMGNVLLRGNGLAQVVASANGALTALRCAPWAYVGPYVHASGSLIFQVASPTAAPSRACSIAKLFTSRPDLTTPTLAAHLSPVRREP